MTPNTVQPITDEQLAKLEQAVAESMLYAVQIDTAHISALIARLRAAENDAERLTWLDRQVEAYGFEGIHEGNRWYIDGPFRDLRTAIDAAMHQG